MLMTRIEHADFTGFEGVFVSYMCITYKSLNKIRAPYHGHDPDKRPFFKEDL